MLNRLIFLLGITAVAICGAPLDCGPGTLTDYLSLQSDGCRLGTRVISGFTLAPALPGSYEIAADDVSVTPTVVGLTGSLLFTIDGSAPTGLFSLLESTFQLAVAPDMAILERVDLRLIGASATSDGVVTGLADVCAGVFTGGVCGGISQPVIALVSATDNLPAGSVVTAGSGPYAVLADLVIDAGSTGTASLTSAQITFSAVPEPASWLLMIGGLAGLFVARGRLNA